MKIMFLGFRALDIYILSVRSKELSYDYGYIPPDIEATVFENLRLGETRGIINLMYLYKTSIGGMGAQLDYSHQYIRYLLSLDGTKTEFIK
jgi:hypothetical protein